MGWTFTHRGKEPVLEFFKKKFTVNGEIRVLDGAVVDLRTAYLAYKTDDDRIIAVVCLLERRPKDYPFDFGYKDMDESMGPNERKCPERILKMLTPLPDPIEGERDVYQYARAWRQRCWDNLKKRKTLKEGDEITFDNPISFKNGQSLKTFQVRKGRNNRPKFFSGWNYYSLGDWQSKEYTVRSAQ